ncbi:unnamed protein product, partial [Rotaria magnacalcarata]
MNVITRYLIREHHIPLTATIIREFSQHLETSLHQQYMIPLSYLNIYRTRKEFKLMKSIQHRLKKGNYILRETDKSGIFHIGTSVDYEKKAEAYRQKTGAYIELDSNPLWSVFDKVILLLNDLRSKKYILSWQLDKMMPKRDTVQLAYLYFIPKPHKAGTPLRPIVSSKNMPTTGISKFLDKIIRPIFDKHARSTTIIDGVDLIHRLEAYTTNGYLKPKTYLCTFDITDLYKMLPQEESLDILIEFLVQHGYQKVQNIPIDIIRKLALIVIKENVFVYEKKFYRQVIEGAMNSAFTLTLANIFMWKWQRQLVHRLDVSKEIYGRYVDDIFFTSNDSLESTDQVLDEANNFHPNIKRVQQIGRNVPFLDVFIQNSNGVLKTSLYHKEAAEPYVVPFGSDHPGHVFRNTVDTAITRAVRYSTTLSEFEEEIRQMKLMFLYNGYPSRHIDWRLTTLFSKYLSNYRQYQQTKNTIEQPKAQLPIKPMTTMYKIIDQDRFYKRCQNYMKQHQDDYELLSSISNMETIVNQHIHKINMTLNFLEHEHYITKDIYQQLFLQRNDIQLKNVYFLFDRSYVKPIFSMESNVTSKLSTYLDDLLRPIIEDILKQSVVNQDFDFIQCLHHHQCSSKLKPTTLLVRIKIQNFFSLFKHQSVVDRIGYLLAKHRQNQPINHISIVTIERLLELYLKYTLFIFEDYIYTFNHGMPNETRFRTLLSNLCLYYWKTKKFQDNQQFQNEFLLQYNDELFFTWNQSKENFHIFLLELKEFSDDDIDMDIEYGQQINIQNIHLENRHGQFYSTMNTSSMLLPY